MTLEEKIKKLEETIIEQNDRLENLIDKLEKLESKKGEEDEIKRIY